jgi:sucrose synthase
MRATAMSTKQAESVETQNIPAADTPRFSQVADFVPTRMAPTKLPRPSRAVDKLIAPDHLAVLRRFCYHLKTLEQRFLLANRITAHLDEFLDGASAAPAEALALRRLLRGCQESIIDADDVYFLLRPKVGVKHIVRVHPQQARLEEISREQYLQVKDAYVQGADVAAHRGLVLDFSPFFCNFPKINEPAEMGEGISLLNRQLSAQMYQNPQVFRHALLSFLRNCNLYGRTILLNEFLASPELLQEEVESARSLLAERPPDAPYDELSHELRMLGFESGWGRTAGDIRHNLAMLARILDSPDPERFEQLLGRLPLVKSVLMVSPHGWFAQDDVLGKPDTGGQVTYVLDQVRAVERELRRRFHDAGIDDVQPRIVVLTRLIPNAEGTTCNVPREKIHGAEDCWIVRVPFRDANGEVVPDWISRFKIWPYLERFADEARPVVVNELLSKPDLIIGHYSDGNLVAYLLSQQLDTTHCAAVHALEKTKYLLSDMHWAGMENDYHFSLQFTADLLAYNSADYIITSSYREIGGTDTDMGMFESYEAFSMPGLYRVVSGFDPKLARHNIVPPGASEEFFFPHTEHNRRVAAVTRQLESALLSHEPPEGSVGHLEQPELPLVFAMARLDKIKNLSGLAEIYGKHARLRSQANLLLITSVTNPELSNDQEEIEEIHLLRGLIEQYGLEGHIRWCARRLDKLETGEIYRIAADRRSVFAQPAYMETFGLTVVEAMACGLPVVVTCFGGPSEIVEPGKSGEVCDPNDHEKFGDALSRMLSHNAAESDGGETWQRYSEGGIRRVREAYSWSAHAQRIVRLANVYSYWNYLDVMNRDALDRYIHTLFHTVYRPRTEGM